MRSLQLRSPTFALGFTLGLVLTGVAFATRRVATRRQRKPSFPADRTIIDGAKPIDPVELAVGPAIEPGAGTIHLAGELDDPPVNSQRW